MKAGDRVRFIKVHKSMNPILRGHEGEAGTVVTFTDDSCLIQFDRSDDAYGRWWIKKTRLEAQATGD